MRGSRWVLRLPHRSDDPLAGGDPLVHRPEDDPVDVANLGELQPDFVRPVGRAAASPSAWSAQRPDRACRDERRRPLGDLGPERVGGRRPDLLGGHNRARPSKTAHRRRAGRPPRPGPDCSRSIPMPHRAASCRRTAAALPEGEEGGTSRVHALAHLDGVAQAQRNLLHDRARPGGTTRRCDVGRLVRCRRGHRVARSAHASFGSFQTNNPGFACGSAACVGEVALQPLAVTTPR